MQAQVQVYLTVMEFLKLQRGEPAEGLLYVDEKVEHKIVKVLVPVTQVTINGIAVVIRP